MLSPKHLGAGCVGAKIEKALEHLIFPFFFWGWKEIKEVPSLGGCGQREDSLLTSLPLMQWSIGLTIFVIQSLINLWNLKFNSKINSEYLFCFIKQNKQHYFGQTLSLCFLDLFVLFLSVKTSCLATKGVIIIGEEIATTQVKRLFLED